MFVESNPDAAKQWLREKRDQQECHDTRIEIVEWSILVFVIFGVILDFMILNAGNFLR
jgi:hypothetical protein